MVQSLFVHYLEIFSTMKVILNNQNVTNEQGIECQDCCFVHSFSLCYNRALRKNTICRSAKILDDTPLNDIFKI